MADEGGLQFNILGKYAGFVTRLLAFVLDQIILAVIFAFTGLAIQFVVNAFRINQWLGLYDIPPHVAVTIGAVIYISVVLAYNVGFWMLAGQTPGKRVMGVRIVRSDGQRLRIGNAIRRQLAYLLSGILFLGFLWILIDDQRQGFHDVLAGTIVVYSWPEEEMRGTMVRDRIQRLVRERREARRQRGHA